MPPGRLEPDSEQADGSIAELRGPVRRPFRTAGRAPDWGWVVKETKPRSLGPKSAAVSPASATFRHRWDTADLNRTDLAPLPPEQGVPARSAVPPTRGDPGLV